MTSSTDLKAFPPVNDTLEAINNIDWDLLKERSRRDLRQIGKVICATSEFTYGLGERLTNI